MGGWCSAMWDWRGGGDEGSFEVRGGKRKVKKVEEVINMLPLGAGRLRDKREVEETRITFHYFIVRYI